MSRNASQFRLIVVLCLAGAAALLLPPETTAGWRAALRDALVPGQMAAHALWNRADDALAGAAGRDSFNRELEDLRNQLAAAESHSRRLELETAQLRQRTEQTLAQYAGYFAIDRREPLFQTALLEARVLGEDASSLWRTRMTIQAGSSAGVVESSLVLNDDRPLLDVGDDGGLHPGDAVYAGRIVLGKVADVGRWSSTLRRLTDPEFSGRARLARRTARGLVFLSEGTLVGDGSELCRLRHISEPVNVGDEVFTGGTDGVLPFPMYYGTVVAAELKPAAREWTVEVKPAAPADLPPVVHVLRIETNPSRLLAD